MEGIDDNARSILVKRVLDIAAYNPDVRVSLNGRVTPVRSFRDYMKLFADDSNIYYEFHWNSVKKEKTDIFGLSCFVINITDRKRAEESMINSENRLHLLIQTITERDLKNFK